MTKIKRPLRISLLAAALGLAILALSGKARGAGLSGADSITGDRVLRVSQALENPAPEVGAKLTLVPCIRIARRPCLVDCDNAATRAAFATTINF